MPEQLPKNWEPNNGEEIALVNAMTAANEDEEKRQALLEAELLSGTSTAEPAGDQDLDAALTEAKAGDEQIDFEDVAKQHRASIIDCDEKFKALQTARSLRQKLEARLSNLHTSEGKVEIKTKLEQLKAHIQDLEAEYSAAQETMRTLGATVKALKQSAPANKPKWFGLFG